MITEQDEPLNRLFEQPAFTALGEKRSALVRAFAEDIQGKNPAEIALRYVKLNRSLSKEERLTKDEREAISEALKESLPEEDRRKFNTVLKLI
jgi:hypothetical protein